MPSRAYTPFLPRIPIQELKQHLVCQCPLGLIPHFYWSQSFSLMHITWASVSMPSRAYTPFLPTTYTSYKDVCRSVNALSGLYPISTNCTECAKTGVGCWVSMPSRAYTPFLRYPFKNLGFMRFSEPVFAGIYQNILTTAVFRAC